MLTESGDVSYYS
jgi:hypothetical protein